MMPNHNSPVIRGKKGGGGKNGVSWFLDLAIYRVSVGRIVFQHSRSWLRTFVDVIYVSHLNPHLHTRLRKPCAPRIFDILPVPLPFSLLPNKSGYAAAISACAFGARWAQALFLLSHCGVLNHCKTGLPFCIFLKMVPMFGSSETEGNGFQAF